MERWCPYTDQRIPLQVPMEECTPKDQRKEQVRFNIGEDLGSDPTLPTELTTFLAWGTVEEQEDTPCPSTSFSMDPLHPCPSKGLKHHPTHMGWAYLKVPVKPSTAWSKSQSWLKRTLDPVNHPSWQILEGMDRARAHPHWWKEIRASKKFTMGSSSRRFMVCENFSKPKALNYAW